MQFGRRYSVAGRNQAIADIGPKAQPAREIHIGFGTMTSESSGAKSEQGVSARPSPRYPRQMGHGRYYFARDPKGGMKRITGAAYDAFHFRGGALPLALADESGMICMAEFIVETEDRTPVRLVSTAFCRYRLLEDGRYDPAHHALRMRAGVERMGEWYRRGDRQPATDVIDAGGRFAQKRLDAACWWNPTEEELDALGNALGHRLALGDLRREQREGDLLGRSVTERAILAAEPGPEWQLRLLAGDAEAVNRAAVAANIWTPPEVLDRLRDDPDPSVLAALARNDLSSPEWLSGMAMHPAQSVRAAVATNPRTPDHVVARMGWADPDTSVQQQAADHIQQKLGAAIQQASSAYAPTWYLSQAARHKRAEVRVAAALNPRLPEKLISVLARDSDPSVKEAIAARLQVEGDPARLFPDGPPKTRRQRGGRQRRLRGTQ